MATLPELIQTITNDGCGKFKEARFNMVLGQACGNSFRNGSKLTNRSLVAATVAADHHAIFFRHIKLQFLRVCTAPWLVLGGSLVRGQQLQD